MAENLTFSRWREDLLTEMPLEPERPETIVRFLRELARRVDDHLALNNSLFEQLSSGWGRMWGEYELDATCDEGMVVYFSGKRMYPASLAQVSKRPRAVVDSLITRTGASRRALVSYGAWEVDLATLDSSIEVGSDVYLSSTPGLVTASPPGVNGSTVMYIGEVGWTVAPVDDGRVKCVFNPGMPAIFQA